MQNNIQVGFMKRIFKKSIIVFLLMCIVLSSFSTIAFAEGNEEPVNNEAIEEEIIKGFTGKTISILGDSICTYENATSGTAAQTTNSTIINNYAYYKNGKTDVTLNDTWWMQAAEKLGARILVNNSVSNSTIFSPFSDSNDQSYISRPYNLHDNTGENAGEEPDIVVVYIGTNDFSYHKSRLGSFDAIDFDALIREIDGDFAYQKPTTSAEAYAIMLHKIKTTYEKAEVYCFTQLQRKPNAYGDTTLFESFNNTLSQVAEHMGCYIVDLYNESGITIDEANYNRYLSDAYLHPNKIGMDAIESVFISTLYKNSKYSPAEEIYDIEYNLKDVIINEGTPKAIAQKSELNITFTKLKYGELDVSVTMNNKDITEDVFSDNKIHISDVTGNIKISASLKKDNRVFENYRFELKDNSIININKHENSSNTLTPTNRYSYKTEDDIILCYDSPWSIIFRAKGYNTGKIIPLSTESVDGFEIVLDTNNAILGISNKSKPNEIYGIDLNNHNIETSDLHTYRIVNSHTIKGTNIYTVYVDTKEIGLLDTLFVNGKATTNDISPIYEKDLLFNIVGERNALLVNYIQIWSNELPVNHEHIFDYPQITAATCIEPGYTLSKCDCGATQNLPNIPPTGHKESEWIISKKTSAVEAGEEYKECLVCNETTQTRTIPQLKCDKPSIKSLTNTDNGIKFTWNAVSGADSYRVYRHLKNGKWVYLCTTTELMYIDTDVKNGYWYYYTVRAVNEVGYSDFYTTGNVIQYLYSPVFKKPANAQNGISLSWNKVNGAHGYYLYKKEGNGNWRYYCRVNSTSFIDNAVKNGVTYSYRIKAVRNKTISGFYYDGISATRLTSPVLRTPVNTDSGTKILWNKMPGAAGYFVYKKVGGYWRYIGRTRATAFTDVSAAPGSVNTYTVKAYDSFGVHSTYNRNGISYKRLTTPAINGATAVDNGIRVNWKNVTGAGGYYIYRKTDASGWKYIGRTTADNFTDKSATKGTNYTYTIKAYSGANTSTYNAKGITAKR